MAGKPLHELRRAAAQTRVRTIPADKVEVVETAAARAPVEKTAGKSMNDVLADAKMRAARGEENEDILAMVKSLKDMLRGN